MGKATIKDLVSVIMPAYNAEKWIAEAIDSILNQTYENIELLVYSDGSTDDTVKIVFEYGLNEDFNIQFMPASINRGVTYALNRLIESSKGKYIARMDADDIAMPDRIEKQVESLNHRYTRKYSDGNNIDMVLPNGVSAVGCEIELFGDNNKNEGRKEWWGNTFSNAYAIKERLPYRNCICHPSVMFRGYVLREYMYKTKGAFQDYDLFLRMASGGHRIIKIREKLLKYRVHNDSVSAKNESDWAEIKLKLRFLAKKFPHWNKFDTHVMRSIWKIIRR